MHLKLTIDSDSDALTGPDAHLEARRLLAFAANRIGMGDTNVLLRDHNGNIVGDVQVLDDDTHDHA